MGEQELEEFYRRVFLPLVRRAAWKHGLTKDDARDIVQDAFVVALGKLDAAGNPKAWLVQVVDHLSINHLRKVTRRAQLSAKWALRDIETEDSRSGPEILRGDQ
jgi:DNA-directed RNA polymerase specialized sigma24 family protein